MYESNENLTLNILSHSISPTLQNTTELTRTNDALMVKTEFFQMLEIWRKSGISKHKK